MCVLSSASMLFCVNKENFYLHRGNAKLFICNCFNPDSYLRLLIIVLSSVSNQAEGKKRMKSIGKVDVPQEAFMAVLKLEKEVI